MAKRTSPNDYFAWYNNDDKLAIVCLVTATDDDTGAKIGEYDTYSDSTVLNGLRIHYHAKYGEVRNPEDDLYKDIGLDSGMHYSLLCYVRARLLEDAGDYKSAQYHRKMFEKTKNEYPMRKSGIRVLSVPRI
jgi:hypothetical protein